MSKLPTIEFDTSRLTPTVLADLERNILELPEINRQNFEAFYDLALRAMATGGDLGFFCSGIDDLNIAGMTGQRVAQISMSLWFKAKGKMDREQQAQIGVTHARWAYSNAPCMPNPKKPTPADLRINEAHRAANGTRYLIAEGLLIDGTRTWPGEDWYCKCSSRSIIPGLERKGR
jgi:hypothetical protein